MMILGCLSRNLIGGIMDAYPAKWTVYIRSICLSILLTRGGLVMNIKKNYFTVAALSIIPLMCEALTIALIAYALFKMPMSLCFALGFSISCIGIAVMVPTHLNINALENITGIAVGILLGLLGFVFNYLPKKNLTLHLKMWYVVVCCIGMGVAGEESTFLRWFQFFVSPLFFSSVGASLRFQAIRSSDVPYGVACIISGLIASERKNNANKQYIKLGQKRICDIQIIGGLKFIEQTQQ
ncbi:cpa1 family transporter: sodium ion proton [Stylonychia lemnae]|uniref:Cpa1 family transporter: sodium ion proton n=1 Tax=Stylonychia lemnae TaxID=5949 RepID=A0A077ZWG8_STYLE|nr:cpa1 family transporter: sodium ion proton [Stylonychia lemnae]|eukprot:CDW74209.1 cpa1 family transporter: sodium ion proton [Stylonychia lemnae]